MLDLSLASAVIRVCRAFRSIDFDVGGGFYRLEAPCWPGLPWRILWARCGEAPRVIASSDDAGAVELAARVLPREVPLTLIPRG